MADYLPTSIKNLNTKLGEQLTEGGGGGGSWTVLTEESVTTSVTEGDPYASGRITYVELITEDTIKITFNDMEYTCQNDSDGIANRFGAPWSDELNGYDFSVYPFAISSIGINGSAMNTLYTESAGTYTIKIEASQSGGSSDFSTAEVTFICNAESEVECKLAIAEKADPPFIPNPQTNSFFTLVNGDESTVAAVLYKGTNCCVFIGATQVSGTGDVSVLSAGQAYITGDCTITIS